MGIWLDPRDETEDGFKLNFWHWRALVEEVRRLGVIDDERAQRLHEPFTGAGLNAKEVKQVAEAIESRTLRRLPDGHRLLIDGNTTEQPDDGTLHKVDVELNYSTNADVLRRFAVFCSTSGGFEVN